MSKVTTTEDSRFEIGDEGSAGTPGESVSHTVSQQDYDDGWRIQELTAGQGFMGSAGGTAALDVNGLNANKGLDLTVQSGFGTGSANGADSTLTMTGAHVSDADQNAIVISAVSLGSQGGNGGESDGTNIGDGGIGGDALTTIEANVIDGASVLFDAVGGYGGYGGSEGGSPGTAGNATLNVQSNTFRNSNGNVIELYLEVEGGFSGYTGGSIAGTYTGTPGAAGTTSMTVAGNHLIGSGTNGTFALLLSNYTDSEASLHSLGHVTVNLTTGVFKIGSGTNSVAHMENVTVAIDQEYVDPLSGDSTEVPVNVSLTGDAMANVLISWSGNDALQGGAGNDTLTGSGGNDTLDGGKGVDTASYAEDSQGVSANLKTGHAMGPESGTDSLISIENLTGGKANDSLVGDVHNNILEGAAGKDTLDGGDGIDTASYQHDRHGVIANLQSGVVSSKTSGNDTLISIENLIGGSGTDVLTGSKLANIIGGGSGADTISGGSGNDQITGGADNDLLTGGKGSDVFIFTKGSDVDTVTDFVATGKVQDFIDLSGYASIHSFRDLDIAQVHHDLHIGLNGGDEIVLENAKFKDIDKSDFHF
jgi:Ca2+-binding RTX toxin-like protein